MQPLPFPVYKNGSVGQHGGGLRSVLSSLERKRQEVLSHDQRKGDAHEEVPTEPNCDLIVTPPMLWDRSGDAKIDRRGKTIGTLKLFSLRSRSGWSPWHDSYPRGSRSIPPPPASALPPVCRCRIGCWSALLSYRPAVVDGSGHFSGLADRLLSCSALCK